MKFTNRWLFLIIGLVVLVVFGFGGYQLGRFFLREPTANTLANKKSGFDSKVKTSLGQFQEIEGTPYIMAPVNSQLNSRQDYDENQALTIHNYLFVNVNDKSIQQLVPKNNFLFVNAQQVVLERRNDKIVRGIWYKVVKADSNNDKRLDNKDKITIAVSDVSGSDYTEVIDKVDRFLGSHQKNSTSLLVFYELDGREYIGEIDILRRVLVEKVVLPAIR